MNTTDRSVGIIDYAIRRRFAFVTLVADRNVVASQNCEVKDKAVALFDNIHQFIKNHKVTDVDISDLMIGHSYFLSNSEEELSMKMEYEVIPLISEYIRDGILEDDVNKELYFNAWKALKAKN